MDQPGHVEAVRKNRSKIEQIVRIKYLSWPVEEPATVLLAARTQNARKRRPAEISRTRSRCATKSKRRKQGHFGAPSPWASAIRNHLPILRV